MESSSDARARILLVHDDLGEAAAVRRALSQAGHDVTLTADVADALAVVERSRPDLVVIAPACDGGAGEGLARDLARPGAGGPPLVLVSDAPVAGVETPRVPRPVVAEALLRAVEAALASAGRATASAAGTAPGAASDQAEGCSAARFAPVLGRASRRDPPEGPARTDPARLPPVDAKDLEEREALRQARDGLLLISSDLEARARFEARRRAELEAEVANLARASDASAQPASGPAPEEPAHPAPPERVPAPAAPVGGGSGGEERGRVVPWNGPRASGGLPASLDELSFPRILALLARAQACGRLEAAAEPVRALWFEAGRVVGAASTATGERTEDVALRRGLLTRDQHRQVASTAAALGARRAGVLLLERGFLKPSELAPLARARAEEVLFALFALEAPCRFHPGEPVPVEERITLERGTLALAVEGVRRRWAPPRLDLVLGGPETLLSAPARATPLADLALSPDEARAAELADGLRTVGEVVAEASLPALATRQLLAALVEVGALEVKVLAPLDAGPSGASRPPPPAAPSPLDLARIEEKLAQVRDEDYFAILGLGRAASAYEIEQAAARLLAGLAPERFEEPGADLLAKLAEIRQVVLEARDVLADDALRAGYLAATAS